MKSLTDEMNEYYYKMSMYELQMMNEQDYYHGLSYNTILYINVISQVRDCTVSKIADMLHVTKSAVTLKMNELVKAGAVEKVQSETDRRVYYLRLSPRMQESVSIYDKVFDQIEMQLKNKYSAEQLELFHEIIHDISGYEWRNLKNE